jgi:phage terminase large subunit-like protein
MQMERSAATLKKLGLSMERLTQYIGNLQAGAQALYDVVIGGNFVAYDAPDLRQHILNAVAKESARGWKLEKEKQRLKIDAAVALSFAVLAATKKSDGKVISTPYKERAEPQVITRGGLTLRGDRYLDRDARGHLVLPAGYERHRP